MSSQEKVSLTALSFLSSLETYRDRRSVKGGLKRLQRSWGRPGDIPSEISTLCAKNRPVTRTARLSAYRVINIASLMRAESRHRFERIIAAGRHPNHQHRSPRIIVVKRPSDKPADILQCRLICHG